MRQQHLNPTQKTILPSQSQTEMVQHSTHPIEQLQSVIGNRAVNQLLENQPTVQAKPMFRGLSHELVVQPKLTIGAVGDKYEQEADRVSEQVVDRMNASENSTIQRQEILEDDNNTKLRMKPSVQRLSDGDGMAATPELETSIQQEKGSGQPLTDAIRQPMERSLGADFSGVKVHTDDRSHQLNRSIQSKAFTTGKDIFFRQGEYNPGSRVGQELIAHELTHVMQQDGEIANLDTPIDIIQRSVGFEFEIDQVTTYKKNFLNQHTNLAKKDVLLHGKGFKIEADEMPGHSNMEFVTDAFAETPDGGEALTRALTQIDGIINVLAANANTEVSAANLGAFGTPVENRFLHPAAPPLIGKPQVTAGIKLDALDRFFSDIATRTIVAGDHAAGNNAARMLGGQLTPNTVQREATTTSVGMLDVSRASEATQQALADVNSMVRTNPDNPVIGGPELRALVTQLVMYLVKGAVGSPGYGKLISGGIMGRTDFAAMFTLLPVDKREYFQQNPNTFVHLVISAASQAAEDEGYTGSMAVSDSVFEGGLYNDRGMYGNDPNFQADLLPQLKRDAWLKGIVQGRDLLTAIHYPGKQKHKEEIESLGGYGAKTDNLSTDREYSTPAPIVELRGLKPLFAGLFMPMALDLFRYIHTVNTGGVETYPGQLLDLDIDERLALIQNQGNAATTRRRLIKEALDEIEWW